VVPIRSASSVTCAHSPQKSDVDLARIVRLVNAFLCAGGLSVLAGWRAFQAAEYGAVGVDDPGWMFTTSAGAPVHPHAISQTFERIVRRTAIPVIRLHDLRHTHGILLIPPACPPRS
jgi:hypothetical protein